MASFCPQCGTTLQPDAKFCEECGAQVAKKGTSKSTPQMNSLVQVIYRSMNKKTTEQLREIYLKHDLNRWSREAFVAIHCILVERSAFTADLPVHADFPVYEDSPTVNVVQYKPSPFGRILSGVIFALGGLFIYLWASRHSPHNLGVVLMGGWDNYIIKEPLYSVIVLLSAGFGLAGIILIGLGLVASANRE